MAKKVVVKLDIHDNKDKRKAMKAVSTLSGIDYVSVDMKQQTMTVVGDVDPVHIVSKLRNSYYCTEILTVGPVNEPDKKEEKKKEGEQHYYNPPTRYYHHVYSVEENPNSCSIC